MGELEPVRCLRCQQVIMEAKPDKRGGVCMACVHDYLRRRCSVCDVDPRYQQTILHNNGRYYCESCWVSFHCG